MPDIVIEDLGRGRQLVLRINDPHPTFRLRTDAIEAAALHAIDPATQDFLEIAAAVFHADGELRRGGSTRPGMGRDWHRNLRFTIPVRYPELWRRADVGEALRAAIRFLTDDQVEFRFTSQIGANSGTGFLDLDPVGTTFKADQVILFSGGLDSFAGALEALSTTDHRLLLVSHRSAQKAKHRQDALAAWLSARFPSRMRHIKVQATRVGDEATDTTQRSRSLLFAAIGHAVAQSFGTRRLSFYENGVVSHNLPISPQITGTMATRTTHPQSLDLLNRLLGLIAPGTSQIVNEYQWMTKTEVVERIARYGGAGMIGQAVSCTHIRDQTTLHTHCGRCSQCLDRRFAVLAAGLETHDPAESYAKDVILGPRGDDVARTLAVEWTRHAIRLEAIDEKTFLTLFGTDVLRIVNGFSEDARESVFRLTLELHRRQGRLVRQVLAQVTATHAAAIVRHQIDPDSLLRLWIGDSSSASFPLPVLGQDETATAAGPKHFLDADLVLDPDGPWTARFLMEGKVSVVDVVGLATVRGSPARVAHLLKDVCLQDVADDRAVADHRFVLIYQLPGETMSKEGSRQYVGRLRNTLASAYELVFEQAPAQPLLIESLRKRGHRLDPRTTILEEPARPG